MKRVVLLFTLLMMLGALCACSQTTEDYSVSSKETTEHHNSTSEETMEPETTTEPTVAMHGEYTLEQCQESPGFYVLYDDGSFDRYYGGWVMNRSKTVYTYGNDYGEYEDLIISIGAIEHNKKILPEGKLVLFWPYDTIVWQGLYAVEESGCTLFRVNEDGKVEGLFMHEGNTLRGMDLWRQGNWKGSYNYTTINGVSKETYDGFPTASGKRYLSFPANQTYTIGAVEGTTLIEKEFRSDVMWFLHDSTESNLTLHPTTGGYAVFDFSDTAPGEYVFTISYWDMANKTRRGITTYILLE